MGFGSKVFQRGPLKLGGRLSQGTLAMLNRYKHVKIVIWQGSICEYTSKFPTIDTREL